ncbi:hypothetical protein [Caminibacter mediatlanticus]|uniref:Uncharacterized protein n=2 Tax=Caminibacter mediatlanticus TaxID=291048 RepID=A0AAI9AFY0_9BACT|nr:hypothetical protein [Caminibacter mediatlanticus]EDM22885.1 hypothetical protein CMTB2_07740 [Caminibacter mediatlanticus TB-2]
MKIAKFIIAGGVSYISSFWIKNIVLSLLIGIFTWYLTLFFLNKWLEI